MALSKQERARAIKKAQELRQGEVKKDFLAEDFEELQKKSLVQLAQRNKEGTRGATEYIKTFLLERQSIFTLRDQTEQVWIYRDGIYVQHGESYIKDFCSRVFHEAYTDRLAKEVIDKIKARTYIKPADFFDAEPKYRICMENGIYDLQSDEFCEHTPEEFHFSKIPVDYEPSATCQKIRNFFEEVLSNPEEDLKVVQELLGWLLIKDYKPEKAVMFYGGGRNGKGKSMEIFQRFIGEDNYSSVSLTELDPSNNAYAAADLMNMLANFGGDVGDGAFRDTSVLRGLTGRDKIQARRKYLDSVKFRNYAKLVFAANKPPRVFDDHDGFWGRWVWLTFPYKFLPKEEYENKNGDEDPLLKVRDPDIVSKVLDDDELSGLFNWAIEGLDRLQENNDFSDEKSQEEIRAEWTRKSDSFAAFCMDCLEEDWDTPAYIEKTELRRAYSVYCREHGVSGVSNDSIKATLQERFGSSTSRITVRSGDRPMCWKGIRFCDEVRDHEDYPKTSVSTLGTSERPGSSYRVLNSLRDLQEKSMEGLVDEQLLVDRLPGVDVDGCLEYLDRKGAIIEPRKGYWQVME